MSPDFDPSKPLKDAQHERFAQLLAEGRSQVAAYEEAGYRYHTANAARLSANESVSQRVAWLKEQAASALVLSIAEKRGFLARVVRTPVGEINEFSDLCQEVQETKDGTKYKMPDKLAAIRLDNDLAGEGARKIELSGTVAMPVLEEAVLKLFKK